MPRAQSITTLPTPSTPASDNDEDEGDPPFEDNHHHDDSVGLSPQAALIFHLSAKPKQRQPAGSCSSPFQHSFSLSAAPSTSQRDTDDVDASPASPSSSSSSSSSSSTPPAAPFGIRDPYSFYAGPGPSTFASVSLADMARAASPSRAPPPPKRSRVSMTSDGPSSSSSSKRKDGKGKKKKSSLPSSSQPATGPAASISATRSTRLSNVNPHPPPTASTSGPFPSMSSQQLPSIPHANDVVGRSRSSSSTIPALDTPPFQPATTAITSSLLKPRRKPKALKEGHTPRPPNSWILYRSDMIKRIRECKISGTVFSIPADIIKACGGASSEEILGGDVSKVISMLWKAESQEVKLKYERLSHIAAAEHRLMYPDYKFQPVRRQPPPPPPTKAETPSPAPPPCPVSGPLTVSPVTPIPLVDPICPIIPAPPRVGPPSASFPYWTPASLYGSPSTVAPPPPPSPPQQQQEDAPASSSPLAPASSSSPEYHQPSPPPPQRQQESPLPATRYKLQRKLAAPAPKNATKVDLGGLAGIRFSPYPKRNTIASSSTAIAAAPATVASRSSMELRRKREDWLEPATNEQSKKMIQTYPRPMPAHGLASGPGMAEWRAESEVRRVAQEAEVVMQVKMRVNEVKEEEEVETNNEESQQNVAEGGGGTWTNAGHSGMTEHPHRPAKDKSLESTYSQYPPPPSSSGREYVPASAHFDRPGYPSTPTYCSSIISEPTLAHSDMDGSAPEWEGYDAINHDDDGFAGVSSSVSGQDDTTCAATPLFTYHEYADYEFPIELCVSQPRQFGSDNDNSPTLVGELPIEAADGPALTPGDYAAMWCLLDEETGHDVGAAHFQVGGAGFQLDDGGHTNAGAPPLSGDLSWVEGEWDVVGEGGIAIPSTYYFKGSFSTSSGADFGVDRTVDGGLGLGFGDDVNVRSSNISSGAPPPAEPTDAPSVEAGSKTFSQETSAPSSNIRTSRPRLPPPPSIGDIIRNQWVWEQKRRAPPPTSQETSAEYLDLESSSSPAGENVTTPRYGPPDPKQQQQVDEESSTPPPLALKTPIVPSSTAPAVELPETHHIVQRAPHKRSTRRISPSRSEDNSSSQTFAWDRRKPRVRRKPPPPPDPHAPAYTPPLALTHQPGFLRLVLSAPQAHRIDQTSALVPLKQQQQQQLPPPPLPPSPPRWHPGWQIHPPPPSLPIGLPVIDLSATPEVRRGQQQASAHYSSYQSSATLATKPMYHVGDYAPKSYYSEAPRAHNIGPPPPLQPSIASTLKGLATSAPASGVGLKRAPPPSAELAAPPSSSATVEDQCESEFEDADEDNASAPSNVVPQSMPIVPDVCGSRRRSTRVASGTYGRMQKATS